MSIKKAVFLVSNTDYTLCPKPDKPEFAFIGRSNVGKSSLINALTNNQKLAKVSGKPGKTQLINHFLIDDKWFLVDLPGYGWAKVSKEKKASWGQMINDYLINRTNLVSMFVLIDSRLDPQPIDVEFVNWLGAQQIPFVLAFTKVDKQSMNKTQSNVAAFRREMLKTYETMPRYFLTSSTEKKGMDEIISFLEDLVVNGVE
jgi:GTP-binding protein